MSWRVTGQPFSGLHGWLGRRRFGEGAFRQAQGTILLRKMVEVAGVEPASLVLLRVASTCIAFNLLSLLKREKAGYSVSRLSKYNCQARAGLAVMPARRRR